MAIENSMTGVTGNPAYQQVGLLRLSEYGFFRRPLKTLDPAVPMMPYDLNTPLFTDYANKLRFIYIPEDSRISWRDREVLDFPTGTVLIKNFYYSDEQLTEGSGKIIETRLLIREGNTWKALPYLWNDSQTEAFLKITGGTVPVQLKGMDMPFEYRVPTMQQCKSCHELNGGIIPIGPTVRQLNRDFSYSEGVENQLNKLIEWDWLTGAPHNREWPELARWDDPLSGTLEDRARAYLDINCGHCHRPGGPGKNSGLDLTVFAPNTHSLGILKAPVAAGAGSGGFRYDIIPGDPEHSIMIYRMMSNDPGVMMPELGRSLVHREGLDLIEEWINKMK